jgi:hypothetical protein
VDKKRKKGQEIIDCSMKCSLWSEKKEKKHSNKKNMINRPKKTMKRSRIEKN